MNKTLIVLGVSFVCYVSYVIVWSMPEDESNKANLILGGCESKDPMSRGTWSIADRAVPPFVRCIVREFRKDQILEARFKYARVETPEHPLPPRESGGPSFMTPVQSFVQLGAYYTLDFQSVNPAINTAMQSTILDSLDWLIENGADPNECGINGLVPLHIAASANRGDRYSEWVGLGADQDIECEENRYQEFGTSPRQWLARF